MYSNHYKEDIVDVRSLTSNTVVQYAHLNLTKGITMSDVVTVARARDTTTVRTTVTDAQTNFDPLLYIMCLVRPTKTDGEPSRTPAFTSIFSAGYEHHHLIRQLLRLNLTLVGSCMWCHRWQGRLVS